MGTGIRLSQRSKVRRNTKKDKTENLRILAVRYVSNFSLLLTFSTGEKKMVDFLPLFQKYVKGDYIKYYAPERFKKFIVKNGNIFWGKNEDVIFSATTLYKTSSYDDKIHEEKTIYII